MNTAPVSIQREGVRIHICQGENAYFKNNSQMYLPVLRESECICTKINSSRNVSCMHWFYARGYGLDSKLNVA